MDRPNTRPQLETLGTRGRWPGIRVTAARAAFWMASGSLVARVRAQQHPVVVW
jgi:hypothetical protein